MKFASGLLMPASIALSVTW